MNANVVKVFFAAPPRLADALCTVPDDGPGPGEHETIVLVFVG